MTAEQQLIRALQNGEGTAFRQLVDGYQERVLNTCLGFVPNMQDAEDLTQDVFIEVFRSIGSFRAEAGLRTWLYRIAANKSLELIRSRSRQKRQAALLSIFGLEERQSEAVADTFNHPGVQLENRERATVLFSKIGQLAENQRTAFILHKVEGLSHKEIGEVMQLSVPAIEALLHRAKTKLQHLLRSYYDQNLI